jgi:acyl-CoA thioester hydrolase
LGFTYKQMEEMGVRMPVVAMEAQFLRPAHYDDLITIKTILKTLPTQHEICFEHEVYNERKKLLTTGKVTLYFISNHTNKRTGMPAEFLTALAPYFTK